MYSLMFQADAFNIFNLPTVNNPTTEITLAAAGTLPPGQRLDITARCQGAFF